MLFYSFTKDAIVVLFSLKSHHASLPQSSYIKWTLFRVHSVVLLFFCLPYFSYINELNKFFHSKSFGSLDVISIFVSFLLNSIRIEWFISKISSFCFFVWCCNMNIFSLLFLNVRCQLFSDIQETMNLDVLWNIYEDKVSYNYLISLFPHPIRWVFTIVLLISPVNPIIHTSLESMVRTWIFSGCIYVIWI